MHVSATAVGQPPHANPLLEQRDPRRWDAIRAEHVQPAVDQLLAAAEAALTRAEGPTTPATWADLVQPLELATEALGSTWGAVGHLNAVADTPELRAAYNAALPAVTAFWTRLGASAALHAQYRRLRDGADWSGLNPLRQRLVEHALRDFRLGGAELVEPQRSRYAAIQERAAELEQAFSEHLLDATNAGYVDAQAHQLTGLPDDVVAAARAAAQAAGVDAWRFTLHQPSYVPVLQHAADRSLREQLYRLYVTRASELGDPALDNSAAMAELLALRDDEAGLLGYPDYATLSLQPKMADTPAQVETFLLDLAERARAWGQRDLADLQAFAAAELGLPQLQAWDLAWASERLREARYAYSEQELRAYFTEPQVFAGLFELAQQLFGITIRAEPCDAVWHPEVKLWRVEGHDGALLGRFYTDLHARAGKRGGAWMDTMRSRWLRPDGTLQTPVAVLVCNFAAGADGRPALLSHDDVQTLFHEFGHGLHHLLTQVDEIAASGLNGVEWDAVELPSQFMENFCWEWSVLQRLTRHVDSGQPLPRALFDSMVAARNFQAGLQTLRQIEFALFDLRIHQLHAPSAATVAATLDAVRDQVAVVRPPAFNRFQHSFSHIFAGGYAAGYYSYKWAEVLSADAYAAFEEHGVLDAETGRRFRQSILEVGSSRDAIASFRAFRGRDPSIDALLRHQGMQG